MNYRQRLPIPGYNQNAVLQLIVATSAGFIMYHCVRVGLIVFGRQAVVATSMVDAYTALQPFEGFTRHPWTLLTYGWAHHSFWEWLTNMLWLYCFGNVVQNLVGYRQVIPTFIYGQLLGGIFYVLTWYIPGLHVPPMSLLTANAGIMALAAATVTLAPKYRFYIGEHFSIPLMVVVGIFVALNGLVHYAFLPLLLLCLGGLLAGYLSMKFLQLGYQPGAWFYSLLDKINESATPDDFKPRPGRRKEIMRITGKQQEELTDRKVDEILDKINQRGYSSLSAEERETLMRASKQNQD
ncbi:MAG: rhomboid family intramembrane serine protease [Bacteroidetes bacterium]|nr:rhomboid family intramembrane serine protease [Bacteroidota bacterium]